MSDLEQSVLMLKILGALEAAGLRLVVWDARGEMPSLFSVVDLYAGDNGESVGVTLALQDG